MRLLHRSLLIPLITSIAAAAEAPASLGPDSHSNETTILVLLGGTLVILGLFQRWFVRR